jgi:foldase protein PrsA
MRPAETTAAGAAHIRPTPALASWFRAHVEEVPLVIRSSRLVVSAGLAVLLLSGCGSGSVRPGAAALVGEERIPVDTLQQVVERGLSDPQAEQALGQDRGAFQRQVLSRLVNREVLQAAAEREGVTVEDGDVAAQLEDFAAQAGGEQALEAQAAQNGISPKDLQPFLRDVVLEQALGDKLTEDEDVPPEQLEGLYKQNIAQYDRVRSRHILVADEAQARSILAQVREDPSKFADLAAEFSTDTSNKDQGGDLGLQGRGQFVPEFDALLFSAEPGTYDVVQTQFGWHVVNVQERETTSLAEATPELRRAALQEQRAQVTGALLREVASDLGVEVNPRFGRWDPETYSVEAVESPNGVTTDAPEEDAEAPAGEAPTEGEQPPLIEEAPEPAPTASE